ncbi:hypothetical protein [Metabacillus schmidteae]|uniref:hypothetical protein n=1 Tax=Metabacillus schmidteae TaxID=2730405 RepID=UPI001589D029|nr:hypothetical protein [Metabacillus schmidteae]
MREKNDAKKLERLKYYHKNDLKFIKTELDDIKRLLSQKDYECVNFNLDYLIDRVGNWIKKAEKEEGIR